MTRHDWQQVRDGSEPGDIRTWTCDRCSSTVRSLDCPKGPNMNDKVLVNDGRSFFWNPTDVPWDCDEAVTERVLGS